jgi:Tol biopolymer transport system component
MACAVAITVAVMVAPASLVAQVRPDQDWHTLTTQHFRIHFPPALEDLARRSAVNAERAYASLAQELHQPRGPVDLVVSDDVDYTNGSATPFPTNRIVIYAMPPSAEFSLRLYDDWNQLVISHELTHIFHLDRARGIWSLAQHIFGRNSIAMPNLYAPAWLTEGLAVYYESRLTGAGRIVATEHAMTAHAAALDGGVPRLDQLSLERSQYPGARSVYVYGSLAIDYLARTRGADKVGAFVERMSGTTIPFRFDHAATKSFGISLQGAWRSFRDSVRREAGDSTRPFPAWRQLTSTGYDAVFPRWTDSTTLAYAANTAKDLPGLYSVGVDGHTRRVDRRNSLGANVPTPDGSILYAQLEYTSPYELRSDLWISRDHSTRRLTTGARLTDPDIRTDESIIAVQATPGTNRLVRVTPDGKSITPLTTTAPDTQWAEPRWAPDGRRIVAVRHARDTHADIVTLDPTGAVLAILSHEHGVIATPSWSPDGATVYFTSDRSGEMQIYSVASDGSSLPERVSDAAAGVFYPELSPNARRLAAVDVRGDGYHIGVGPAPRLGSRLSSSETMARNAMTRPEPPPLQRDSSRATQYSPWRLLVPRYWLPTAVRANDNGVVIGALTSAYDVVGRHAYSAALAVNTGNGALAWDVAYDFAGFGQPVISTQFVQSNDYSVITDTARVFVGYLRERSQRGSASVGVRRQRYRTAASASIGAEVERLTYTSDPGDLLARLRGADVTPRNLVSLIERAGWTNVKRPALSISPEDGLSVSAVLQQRRQTHVADLEYFALGVARAYQALPFPGYAHHVLAIRAAGGWSNSGATSTYSVGGTSGGSLELVPGYSVGTTPRTFGVRGFRGSRQRGLHAVSATAEYRAPLAVAGHGIQLLPVFLDRISLAAFADAGSAWCAAASAANTVCRNRLTSPSWLVSTGAELNLDTALQYDIPYRFRLGLAFPVRGRLSSDAAATLYFTVGAAF